MRLLFHLSLCVGDHRGYGDVHGQFGEIVEVDFGQSRDAGGIQRWLAVSRRQQ